MISSWTSWSLFKHAASGSFKWRCVSSAADLSSTICTCLDGRKDRWFDSLPHMRVLSRSLYGGRYPNSKYHEGNVSIQGNKSQGSNSPSSLSHMQVRGVSFLTMRTTSYLFALRFPGFRNPSTNTRTVSSLRLILMVPRLWVLWSGWPKAFIRPAPNTILWLDTMCGVCESSMIGKWPQSDKHRHGITS